MGFSRQEYWSALPFPSLGDLPEPGIKPGPLALQVDSLPLSQQGSQRRLNTEELMLSNCGAGEDSWEALGQQGEQTRQSQRKSVLNIHWKRVDVEVQAPIFWWPDVKSRHIGKKPDAGKDWGQEDKGAMEVEMVGWHHQLYGHEFEQTPGDSEEQGSLVCCSPWGHKESDMT